MHALTYLALCAVVSFACAKRIIEIPTSVIDKVRPIEEECIKESGSIPDSLHHMLVATLPINEANNKFIWCFGSKSGYMDNTAHFVVNKFLELAKNVPEDRDNFINALNECNQNNGADLAELASKLYTCFHEKSPYAFPVPK